MKDSKNIIPAIIIGIAIIIASVILSAAIKEAGWFIIQGLDHVSTSISTVSR